MNTEIETLTSVVTQELEEIESSMVQDEVDKKRFELHNRCN